MLEKRGSELSFLVLRARRKGKEPQLASADQTPCKPTECEMLLRVIRGMFVILRRARVFAKLCQLGKNIVCWICFDLARQVTPCTVTLNFAVEKNVS